MRINLQLIGNETAKVFYYNIVAAFFLKVKKYSTLVEIGLPNLWKKGLVFFSKKNVQFCRSKFLGSDRFGSPVWRSAIQRICHNQKRLML